MGKKTKAKKPPTVKNYTRRLKKKLKALGLPKAERNIILADEQKFFNLDNITIEKVNEFIGKYYDLIEERVATKVVRKLKNFSEETEEWDVIDSSINNNDCLVHSFLMATCPNFRKCAQKDKDEFANFFRRVVFLRLPAVICYSLVSEDYAEMATRVMGAGFLQDPELLLLAAQFKFRVLSASEQDDGNKLYLINSELISGLITEACSDPDIDDSEWPIICIYTNMAHFEAVRAHGDYEITEEQVESALEGL